MEIISVCGLPFCCETTPCLFNTDDTVPFFVFPPFGLVLLLQDGKVLDTDSTLAACGITATSFLVAFAKKPKKKKVTSAPTPAPAPAPTATPAAPTSASPTPVPAATTTPAPTATPTEPPAAPQQPAQPAADPATLQQIMEISGTDENTARTALAAAFGNAERAIQYIFDPSAMPQVQQNQPPQQQQGQPQPQSSPSATTPSATGGTGADLQALRNHPTFPQLQRLIQSNPSALPQVLGQISNSNPQLFAVIQSNPDAFVAMLNEPIAAQPAQPAQPMGGGGMPGMPGMPGGMGGMGGMGGINPAQLAGLINSLPDAQLQALGQQLGMSVDQLRAMGQQMSNMPPQQLQAMMQMMGGMGGMGGMPQGGPQGGPQPGQIQINLTPEQRTDVDSLVNMGLGSQSECLQIYLACDKDVNQAASILMDQAQ